MGISKGQEGLLTQYRSILVGNKRLFKLGSAKNLPKLISPRRFEPHLNWKSPKFSSNYEKESLLIKWDEEFRDRINDDENEVVEANENVTKKVKASKVNLFQVMTQEELLKIGTPEFEGKDSFLKRKIKEVRKDAMSYNMTSVQPKYHKMISDKAIADVVEALIGVHLAKGGQDVAAKFLSWLGLDLNPEKEIKDIINRKDDETSPSI